MVQTKPGVDMHVDPRLVQWYEAIHRRIGSTPMVTDARRTFERQLRYYKAGYGANPNKGEGAAHVMGRALDIRTLNTGITKQQWESIAWEAARDAGLQGKVWVKYHTGTAPHLHLEMRGWGHAPDNCPDCTSGKKGFAENAGRVVNKVGRAAGNVVGAVLGAPIRAVEGLARGIKDGLTGGEPQPYMQQPYMQPMQVPYGAYPLAAGGPHVQGLPINYAQPAEEYPPGTVPAGQPGYPPQTQNQILNQQRMAVHRGRKSFSENLPNHIDAQNGGVMPSNRAAQNYAAMTGRNGQVISLGENRLATLGETRAALLREITKAGGENIRLQDLKQIAFWKDDKAQLRQTVDDFIKSRGLQKQQIYTMLGQSERMLRRRDPALFGGGLRNPSLGEIINRSQALEEARLGGGAPAQKAAGKKAGKGQTQPVPTDPAPLQ